MISVFKKNDLLNFVLLLPYAIVLRMYSLIHPVAYVPSEKDSFLSTWLLGDVLTSPMAQAIVAIVLIYGQAVLINILTTNHRLYRIPSALSGMCYILLMSGVAGFQLLSPAIIGMTFVILSSYSVFNTYKKQSPASAIFNAAISGAFAVLIYPPYAVLLIAFGMGLTSLVSFTWKAKLQFLLGFLVIFWILGGCLFFFDVLDWSFVDQIGLVGSVGEILNGTYEQNIVAFGGLGLVLTTLFNYYNYRKKKGIEVRKKIDYFYWMLLTGFVALLLFKDLELQHLLFLSLGLSIFLGMTFAEIRQVLLAELIHVLALGTVFYFQFWY